jgi:hypothetical protein
MAVQDLVAVGEWAAGRSQRGQAHVRSLSRTALTVAPGLTISAGGTRVAGTRAAAVVRPRFRRRSGQGDHLVDDARVHRAGHDRDGLGVAGGRVGVLPGQERASRGAAARRGDFTFAS